MLCQQLLERDLKVGTPIRRRGDIRHAVYDVIGRMRRPKSLALVVGAAGEPIDTSVGGEGTCEGDLSSVN